MDMQQVIDELTELGEPICIGERMGLRGDKICGRIASRGLCSACYNYLRKEGMLELIALPKGKRGPKVKQRASKGL